MGRQKEVAAWQIHRELVDSAVDWVKNKAESIEQFPQLPNGEPGLQVGESGTAYFRMVLRPQGDLVWVMHDTYEYQGRVKPAQYLSQTVFDRVEEAVDKYNKEYKPEAKPSRFSFFRRPERTNLQQ